MSSFTRLYLSPGAAQNAERSDCSATGTPLRSDRLPHRCSPRLLSSAILACNYVSSVSLPRTPPRCSDGLIGFRLNYVVILVIVCAAALAAVVLYSRSSASTWASAKGACHHQVLGFYDKEVYHATSSGESTCSLSSAPLVGLLGIPLHQFIITL